MLKYPRVMCNNHTDSILNFYTLCKMDRSWFWFKNTIVPFPIGHESLCPRGSACPQAQQCAAIDFKTISARALEKKNVSGFKQRLPDCGMWKGWGGYSLSVLNISAACESFTQYSIKMEKGDKTRETLAATVFPTNMVLWSWEFLLCWREKK